MFLFRNRYISLICLISLGLQLVVPSSALCAKNPNERTASVIVGKYDVVKDSHAVPFLDHLAANGIPAIYGEILNAAAESAGKTFTDEAWKGGEIAKQLATQKYVRDSLGRIAGYIGDLNTALDVGGKIYSEQYDEAAVSASLAGLSKLAASNSGAAALKAIGITSTAYVTAVIVAFTVWRESSKALASETQSRQLESLYGSVEIALRLKPGSTGRSLGEGDPFPVSSENIAKIWKKVLNDPSFRSLFRVYVTDQLKKDFPEPGFFDTVDSYLSAPWAGVKAEDVIEDRSKQALIKEYSTLKSYIAGLVSWLNRAAKVREQQVVARRELKKLADKIKQASGESMEKTIQRMDKAIIMLGVVETYLKDCNERIDKAAKEKDYDSLQAHLMMASDYVKDVIAWIPSKGPIADRRNRAFDGLKQAYSKADGALKLLLKEFKEKLEKPKPPEETTEQTIEELPEVDTVEMFKAKFGKILKPFNWGGVGDVSLIKDHYLRMLEKGQFKHPLDTDGLPDERKPVAEEIEAAWAREDYPGAAGNGTGNPAEEDTIEGYKKYLLEKIADTKTPDEIISLSDSVSAQGKRISEIYHEGNNLYWGKDADGNRIKGETKEQTKARRERGQALMDQSSKMGAALKPSRDRLKALNIAWEESKQMAGEAAGNIIAVAEITREKTTVWMKETRAFAENNVTPLYEQYLPLKKRYAFFEEYYRDNKESDTEKYIDSLKDKVSDNSYVGLQGTKIKASTQLYLGAMEGINKILSPLYTREDELRSVSRLISDALEPFYNLEYTVEQWKDFKEKAVPLSVEINTYIDPQFLNGGDYSSVNSYFTELEKSAPSYVEDAQEISDDIVTYIENIREDISWLQRAANNLKKFRDTAIALEAMIDENSFSVLRNTESNMVDGRKVTRSKPYFHYLTKKELNNVVSELNNILSTNLGSFLKTVAPWLNTEVQRFMKELSDLPVVNEENFFTGTWIQNEKVHVVLKSKLNEAESLAGSLVPGTDTFDKKWSDLRELIPVGMKYTSPDNRFVEDMKVPADTPLGKDYLALREKIKELYYKHLDAREKAEAAMYANLANQAIAKWSSLVDPIKQRIKDGEEVVKKSLNLMDIEKSELVALKNKAEVLKATLKDDPYSEYEGTLFSLDKAGMMKNQYASDYMYIGEGIKKLPSQLSGAISKIEKRLLNIDDKSIQVRQFYEKFQKAYEEQNDMGLMNCLSDEWEAGDGTTLWDVEDYFRNMFTVFDDIRLDISNMKIEKLDTSNYRVSYTLQITGRIFSNNIKHEEKSSVVEEVNVSDSKRVRITRTPEGRFWYIN